jgi:acyl transferase domain-containing protein
MSYLLSTSLCACILTKTCEIALTFEGECTHKSLIFFTYSLGMLSAEGRCKTLDSSADGYVRGEGVGALLLAPLQANSSRQLGQSVLAVLRGSAVNQDGRSSALTAPNGTAQQASRAGLCGEGLMDKQHLLICFVQTAPMGLTFYSTP